MSNITGNISNSFVREPLNAALINSVTGFTLGTTFGLITGNNIRESLRYGAGGAATGLVTGIMSGLSKAIVDSRANKCSLGSECFISSDDPRYQELLRRLIKLDGAYHQMITNEFRRIHGYGSGYLDITNRYRYMNDVYKKFPLPY